MEMNRRVIASLAFCGALACAGSMSRSARVYGAGPHDASDSFHTSDRCVACHNNLVTPSGKDVSIGVAWRSSIMANAGRDPYWQASVRRESVDHPESTKAVEDDCSICHMPMQHLIDRGNRRETEVFTRFPKLGAKNGYTPAADGVSCSVCHQVEVNGLGTPQTFSGNVQVAPPLNNVSRPEYGPFDIDGEHQEIMRTSTVGFMPSRGDHIRDSALCGSCHTLYTVARGPGGKEVGQLAEQMPYLEWQHSDYRDKQSCQQCHMPEVKEQVQISSVFGPQRQGLHQHLFLGGNFLMQGMLQDHAQELAVNVPNNELQSAAHGTMEFLQSQATQIQLTGVTRTENGFTFTVQVKNLTGHKLPTAYPSRRAWLHVLVRDNSGKNIFESGALRPDGSIVGNRNDADPFQYEPHFPVITDPQQVEIFESILKDQQGHVTTGLLAAVGYLKDNRILPTGFDKATAKPDIAVIGAAAADANFTGGESQTRYEVRSAASGQIHVTAELWYQPIGFRWAHNLEPYKTSETERFVSYYNQASSKSAILLAAAQSDLH
jgi:hypothetical protein